MIMHQNKPKKASNKRHNRAPFNRTQQFQNPTRRFNNKFSYRNYDDNSSSFNFQFSHNQPTNRKHLVKTFTYRPTSTFDNNHMPPEFPKSNRSVSSSSSYAAQPRSNGLHGANEHYKSNHHEVKNTKAVMRPMTDDKKFIEPSSCKPATMPPKPNNEQFTKPKIDCLEKIKTLQSAMPDKPEKDSNTISHKRDNVVTKLENLMNSMCQIETPSKANATSPAHSYRKETAVSEKSLHSETSQQITKSVQFASEQPNPVRSHISITNNNKPKHKLSTEVSRLLNKTAVMERSRNPLKEVDSDFEIEQEQLSVPEEIRPKKTEPKAMPANEIFNVSVQAAHLDEAVPECAIVSLQLNKICKFCLTIFTF